MACASGSFTGYDILFEVAYSCPSTQPAEAAYKRIGMLRGKTWTATNATSETTGDTTVGRQKSYAVTTVEYSGSFDGVCYTDTAQNQLELYLHAMYEGNQVGGVDRGYVWVQIVFPDMVVEGPALISTFERTASNEEQSTFSFEIQSAGGSYGFTVDPV